MDNAELYERLLAAYSIPGDDRAQWLVDMGDLFDDEDFETVKAAVERYRRQVKPAPTEYVRVPTPEAFSDWVQQEKDAAEREQRKALPAPPDDGSWFRRTPWEEVWARFQEHYLYGKARQRKRNRLIDAYRRANGIPGWCGVPESVWKGLDEPTATELAAVRAEVETQAWWQRAQLPAELKFLERTRTGMASSSTLRPITDAEARAAHARRGLNGDD